MKQQRTGLSGLAWLASVASVAILGSWAAGCAKSDSGDTGDSTSSTSGQAKLSGDITIDGSSTVFPISQAVAEEFMKTNPDVNVTAAASGTGGGFKKFTVGEIDITGASRPIKDEEAEAAKTNGIEYVEIPVAYDGLSVVLNPQNDWVDSLTVEELKKIWEPNSKVNNWSQVRAGFPNVELKLFGPGTDSGTFDYFTDEIVGEEGASRTDYTPSEDDNVLVQGVAGERGGLGYFGYSYYIENKDKLKLAGVDGGDGPVVPSEETINDGSYKPLSRPIFIYVSKKALARPEVKALVEYFLSEEGRQLVSEVGYVQLPAEQYADGLKKVQS